MFGVVCNVSGLKGRQPYRLAPQDTHGGHPKEARCVWGEGWGGLGLGRDELLTCCCITCADIQ